MPTLQATVKAVLSGDTIILHAVNNPAQERHLNLAAVSAPRLRREGDEVSTVRDILQLDCMLDDVAHQEWNIERSPVLIS